MRYKALFVDLGGVLILNHAKEIGEKFEEEYGLKKETAKDIFRYIQTRNRSKEDISDYLRQVKVDDLVWEKYTKELYSSEQRNETLIKVLIRVKEQGVKVVFTSNNSTTMAKIIEKYGISFLADLIINSSEFGVAKPDESFWELSFRETVKILSGIKKDEVLVIDDSVTNIDSAKKYGLSTILYQGELTNDELAKELFR